MRWPPLWWLLAACVPVPAAAEAFCLGAFWEGHVAYGHPLVIQPIGLTKVAEFGFTCLQVIVERDKAVCGNYELQLVNGQNDLYDLLPYVGRSGGNFSMVYNVGPGPVDRSEWRMVLTNTNSACKYQQIAVSMTLTVDPLHRLCPAPNNTDCSGHGVCNLSNQRNQCVCHTHWKCVGLPCTCEQCQKGWKGPDCNTPAGTVWAAVVLYSSILLFISVIAVHLYIANRSIQNTENTSLLHAKDSMALFQVQPSREAPHLRTKLYF